MSSMSSHTHYSKTPYFSLHVKPRALMQKTIISSTEKFRKKYKEPLFNFKDKEGCSVNLRWNATPTFYLMDRYTFISEICFVVK